MISDNLTIGQFSYITRLTQKALRIYDEKEILIPAGKDRFTGYRYYSHAQIGRGVIIKTLISLGFSLDEIKSLLTAKENGDLVMVRSIIQKRQIDVQTEITRLHHIGALLKDQEKSLELIPMTTTDPVIKTIPDQKVVTARKIGEYEEVISSLIDEMHMFIQSDEFKQAGAKMAGPYSSLFHDKEYKEKDADIEVAFPVQGKVPEPSGNLSISIQKGGKFVSLIYKGPYYGLHEGWAKVYTYAHENGISPDSVGRVVYLNSPCDVPEDELITEILLPINS